MSRQIRFTLVLALALASALGSAVVMAQGPEPQAPQLAQVNAGTAFAYQGDLKSGGLGVNGSCNIAFRLFDASSAGVQFGPALTQTVAAVNGVFTTLLDFGTGAFNGEARWLEMRVRCPAGSGGFTLLTPRQALTPTPIALTLPGVRTEQKLTTTNIIAGFRNNAVLNGAQGATIGGGGSMFYTNTVSADFGTIGGGEFNHGLGIFSTIGGGSGNYVSGYAATIAGGYLNSAQADYGTIDGGQQNYISPNAFGATIAGGLANNAYGFSSFVAGGLNNNASGAYSFAGGLDANAQYTGTFVWADATSANGYSSSAPNQMAIRATNGVSLAVNAGYTKTVQVGERYRDNALVAWAKVDATGVLQNSNSSGFGIAQIAHLSTGEYGITTTAKADSSFDLIPMAIAELDGVPINASGMRVVSINQIDPNHFEVYINTGTGTLVDNDFVVMVTAR